MAAGKSTFGKALATKCGVAFVDLDDFIEERMQMSVSDIFRQYGEDEFRRIENECLHLVSMEDVIVACGGGTPCFHSNMEFMNEAGITIWLQASKECIMRRLSEQNSSRPLVAGMSETEMESVVNKHMKEREPFYSQARIYWDGEKLENETEITENIISFLQSMKDIPMKDAR